MAMCADDAIERWAPEVRRLGDVALTRLGRAGNAAARPLLLQRYAEAVGALGDDDTAAALWRERDDAMQALPFAVLDFWPQLPPRAEAQSPREYWIRFAASSGNLRSLGDPSSETQGDVSRPSHLLDQLSTIIGYKPSF
jgi:hypothetical protein